MAEEFASTLEHYLPKSIESRESRKTGDYRRVMVRRKAIALLRKANLIFQTEGLLSLLRRGLKFLAGCFFRWNTYYLYEDTAEDLKNMNEADFMPKIDNFTFEIVSTNQQADELSAKGLGFRSYDDGTYRDRLDKGAIAFCVFVGRELAHIHWVATTEEAKDSLNQPPYAVDFSNNEVCHGGVWTNDKYRGRGLHPYVSLKARKFLVEMGKVVNRSVSAPGNIPAQRGHAKLNLKMRAEARHLKILWWESWKEKTLTQSSGHGECNKLYPRKSSSTPRLTLL